MQSKLRSPWPANAPIPAPSNVPPGIAVAATVFVVGISENPNKSLLHVNEDPVARHTSAIASSPTAPKSQLLVIGVSLLYAATRSKHCAFSASQRA